MGVKIIGGSKPADMLEERFLQACMNQFIGGAADRAANGAKLAAGLRTELARLGIVVALDSDMRVFNQGFELSSTSDESMARQKEIAGHAAQFAMNTSQAVIGAGLASISYHQPPHVTNPAPKMQVIFTLCVYTPGLTQALENNKKKSASA